MSRLLYIALILLALTLAAAASATSNPIVDIVNGRYEERMNKLGLHKCMCCDGRGYIKGKPEGN